MSKDAVSCCHTKFTLIPTKVSRVRSVAAFIRSQRLIVILTWPPFSPSNTLKLNFGQFIVRLVKLGTSFGL